MQAKEFVPVEGYEGLKHFRFFKLRRNGVYYIVRKIDGKVKRISLETHNLDEAVERYNEQIGEDIPEGRNVYVRAAWETFIESDRIAKSKTRKRYRTSWATWVASQPIANLPVHKVQPKDVIQVLDRARRTKSKHTGRLLSESSLRNIYVCMSAFFTACTEEPTRYRKDNPVSFIGKKRPATPVAKELGDIQFLSVEEIDAIAVAVMDRQPRNEPERVAQIQRRVIAQVSPELGTRISETLGLKVSDFKRLVRPHGVIHVERQIADERSHKDPRTWFETLKGHRGTVGDQKRTVALSPFAERVLGEYVDQGIRERWLRAEGLLFPSSKHTPRAPGEVGAMISAAAERAGIPHRIVSHYFRHTWASRALAEIESEDVFNVIGEVLGHHPEVARKRYAHRSERHAVAFNSRVAAVGRQ